MSSPSHSPHLVTPQYNPINSFGLCVILSLLTSSNAIVQNLSKDPVTHVYPYDPTSLPLGSEILKLAIALAYVRLEKDTSNNKRPRKSSSHVSLPNAHLKQQSPLEVTYHSIVYLLPSLLYFMKNTSDTISLQHLQPPTFQVYSNLKIVFTAVLSRLYFTRPCSDARWAYLLFLSIGASMSHTDIHEDYKPETSSIDHTFGVLMCVSGCVLSAAAAVSLEGLVKNDDSNPNPLTLMESNVRLYSYGILSHVVVRTSGLGIHTLPYWFVGYNSWGLIALVNQAFMGLAVSFVVHRINSMAKLLSGCGSMVVSLLVSNAVFGTMITPKVVGSILIVSVSIWGYNRADTVRVDKGKTKSDRGNFVDSLISSTVGSCCGSSQRDPNYTAKRRRKRQSQTVVFIVGSLLLTALLSGVAFEGTGATKFYDTKFANGEQVLKHNQKQAPPAASAPPKPKKKPCSYLGPKKARESFEEVKAHMESNKDLSRCVLIGNGPSLNKMSWDWVDTFPGVVLATNKFYIGFERFNNIKPDMYVVVNGLVAEQSSSFMQELLHEPDTFLFAGSKIADNFECDEGASDVNARPIIFKQINTKEPPCRFCEDPAKAVNLGWTVTYASLQLLYYVGCQEVVIVGMDHHFEQSGKPGETQKLGSVDVNHFDGSYFANQEWQLAGLEKSESSYKVAEKFYRDNGRKIVDATVGGHCDIFEKGDVNDLLL